MSGDLILAHVSLMLFRQDGKDYLKVLNFAKYEIDCEYSLHADKHGKKRRQRSKKAAMAKFRELDDDNSGYLRGHEMRVLAAWVHETGFDNWRGRLHRVCP